MFKKLINGLCVLTGLMAIGLCVGFAIKTPSAYGDLFGYDFNQKEGSISQVPYLMNFGDVGNDMPTYKSNRFSYSGDSSYYWYCSWGNPGSKGTNPYNYLLGWNDKTKVDYGTYLKTDGVLKAFKDGDIGSSKNTYSFMLMDFDFNMNHYACWSFSYYDSFVSDENTRLVFIESHNSGSTWSILSEKSYKDMTLKGSGQFEVTQDNITTTKTRYGVVLVSSLSTARIEMNQFYTKRISLV